MIDFLKYRYYYFLVSALIILPGIVFMLLGGLKPGIDYTSGTEITVMLSASAAHTSASGIEAAVRSGTYRDSQGRFTFKNVVAQGVTDQRAAYASRQEYIIQVDDIGARPQIQTQLIAALSRRFGHVTQLGVNTVGASVGAQTTQNAAYAVVAAAVAILLYIAYAFRKLDRPFIFGAAAIVALMHDVLVVLGLFGIMGYFFDVQIDALFLPAVLTVIGFSVHDTIVVFDRIRENAGRRTGESFYTIANISLAQTLGRSLNTSITVVLTLVALLLFGGASIHIFVLALLIGIISGTYSSIFNATPLAVMWSTGELRLPGRTPVGRAGRS